MKASLLSIVARCLVMAQPSANAAPPAAAPAGKADAIELPAKTAMLRGRGIKRDADGNLSEWTQQKEWVEWLRIVPVPGWYEIEITQASTTDTGTYDIGIGGQTIAAKVQATAGQFRPVKVGYVLLGKNQTSLTLKPTKIDGAFMKVSGILLRPSDAPVIEPASTGVIDLAATSATLKGEVIRVDHTGTITDLRINNTAEWSLLVKKAGTYEVEVCQGAPHAGGEYTVTVGGEKLTADVVATGEWRTCQPVYIGAVRLKEGKTTLTVLGTRQVAAVMSMQWVRLTPTDKPRPAPAKIAQGRPGTGRPVGPPVATNVPKPGTTPPSNKPIRLPPTKGPGRPDTKLQLNPRPVEIGELQPRVTFNSPESVQTVCFGADSSTVFMGAARGVTKAFNARTGKEVANLTLQGSNSAHAMALSPDKKMLAVVGDFSSIKILNSATGAEISTWPAREMVFGVDCVGWSPSGQQLATAGGKKLVLWNVAAAKPTPVVLPESVSSLIGLTYTPDGKMLVAVGTSETPGRPMQSFILRIDPVAAKAGAMTEFAWVGRNWISARDSNLVMVRSDTGGQQFDLPSGKKVSGHGGVWSTPCGAVSPDGRLLALGSTASEGRALILIHDLASNNIFARLVGHTDKIVSLAFSADGKTLVSGSDDKTVRVYDVPASPAAPIDLKGIAGEITGRWEATPVVDANRFPAMLRQKGVPPEKIDAASAQMRQMMEGMKLSYVFERDGRVTVTVTSGGKTQEQKGRFEILRAWHTQLDIRLTSDTAPADLLRIDLAPDDPDKFSIYQFDAPVRMPVEFTRVK